MKLRLGEAGNELFDTAADQEVCLSREARNGHAGITRRFSHCSEVHPRADVLNADVNQRVVMKAMPVMTQQRALVAFFAIVLPAWQSVVDQDRYPRAHRQCQALHPTR